MSNWLVSRWKWERSVEEGICEDSEVMRQKWMEWFCSNSGFDTWYKTNELAHYATKLKELIVRSKRSLDKVYDQARLQRCYEGCENVWLPRDTALHRKKMENSLTLK